MAALHCQKCKTPLTIDASLQHLNPASFKLLADAAPVLQPKAPDPRPPAPRPPPAPAPPAPPPRPAAATQRRQLGDGLAPPPGPPPVHMSYIMLSDAPSAWDAREPPATPPRRPNAPQTSSPPPQQHPAHKAGAAALADGQTALSQEMESTMRLFDILSARSDVDHPVCSECTELLLDGLQRRQASVSRERDAYVAFLNHARHDMPSDEEKATTERRLAHTQQREQQALRELEQLEAEKARMEEQLAALDAEAEALDDEEEQFWRERNAFLAELAAFQEERDSLQVQLAHDSKVLEALQRTNVYNDTFCIGHDGTFGTINGLRLGRTPDHPVDWPEINAAWGQTLLLLTVVTEKLGITLEGFELLPVGSASKVVKVESSQTASATDRKPKKTVYQLFSSGDLPLALNFLHRNFDYAMVAFLECLRQVGEHVERTTPQPGTPGLKMPYPIVKDKIGHVSIKLSSFGQDEQWTKACKYTLTCCKFLLAHASHMPESAETRNAR